MSEVPVFVPAYEIPVVCDEHDRPMERDPAFCGWTCSLGDASFGDLEYLHLTGRLRPEHNVPPQIRVTGCKNRGPAAIGGE